MGDDSWCTVYSTDYTLLTDKYRYYHFYLHSTALVRLHSVVRCAGEEIVTLAGSNHNWPSILDVNDLALYFAASTYLCDLKVTIGGIQTT